MTSEDPVYSKSSDLDAMIDERDAQVKELLERRTTYLDARLKHAKLEKDNLLALMDNRMAWYEMVVVVMKYREAADQERKEKIESMSHAITGDGLQRYFT